VANLADILVTLTLDTKQFNDNLKRVSRDIQNMSSSVSSSATEMTSSVQQSMTEVSTSVSDVGKSTSKLSRTVGTDMASTYNVIKSATREFNEFGMTGRRVSQQVSEQFKYLPSHLKRYVQRLQDAGKSTEAFGRLNEMYGRRWVEQMKTNNDFLQQKTKQSTSIIKALAEQDIQPLSRQFLKLGERLEQNAKQGTALNLALTMLGENASPKQLQDRMKLIQQGIGRARVLLIGMGIATGLATYGLVLMSNEVDGRLLPAFEELKSVWLDALTPFVKVFTTAVLWIMNGAIAVGELMKAFAEAHPQLSAMLWGFIYLTMVITTLLAPMAIGIGLGYGMSAMFAVLWSAIAPFVLGFLTVAGVAVLVAGAIVIVVAVLNNLWKSSEAFREAWVNVWNGVKQAFMTAFVEPVVQAWGRLKTAFSDLIATFTGGEGTMSNLWTFLGDKIAIVVNAIANVVLPILKGAFALLAQVVVGVINGIIVVIGWLGDMWQQHGTQITAVMAVIWGAILQAFSAVKAFIMSIMPSIKGIISDTFNAVKVIIDFVMKYIAPVVVGAFMIIWKLIQVVMPAVLQIIKGTWDNIKSVITSTIAIIRNVIQLFTNVLKGNWKGAWENVKAILKNAVILIWNLVQLYFLGKLLAPLKGFASAGKGLMKSAWTGFLNIIKGVMNAIKTFVVAVWQAVLSALRGKFVGIANLARTVFNGMKNTISSIFNGIRNTASSVWNRVKDAMVNPIQKARDTILSIIGKITGAFARMKISIPKFKMPSISVGSKSFLDGKVKIPTFKVSWNAKGAIFNGASILGGGQGVGEAGAEAVMPIQHKRYMRPFSNAVASDLAKMNRGNEVSTGNKYEVIFNQPVVIREDADIQRIVDEMERRKRIAERAKGVLSF